MQHYNSSPLANAQRFVKNLYSKVRLSSDEDSLSYNIQKRKSSEKEKTKHVHCQKIEIC